MTFISYAQNFEDVMLWRALRTVEHGFYIDVGAQHPDTDSVTRAFYDRGWRGLNIEPVPDYHARLCAARPLDISLRIALGRAASSGRLHVIAGTGLSTTDDALALQHGAAYDVRTQDVEVQTLAQVCETYAPPAIHFLKIDVEGAEAAVLQGADFTRFRPWLVLVEATAPGTTVQTHEEWEPLLVQADYRFVWFDGLNRFYAAAERHAELALHFAAPVNVFDDFVRATDTEWVRRISQAEAQLADLMERAMTAEAAIELAERRTQDADARAQRAEARAQRDEPRALGAERRADAAERRLQETEARLAGLGADMQMFGAAFRFAQRDAAALRQSTSWRLTAPLRAGVKLARGLAGRAGEVQAPPVPHARPGWDLPPAASLAEPVAVTPVPASPTSTLPAPASPAGLPASARAHAALPVSGLPTLGLPAPGLSHSALSHSALSHAALSGTGLPAASVAQPVSGGGAPNAGPRHPVSRMSRTVHQFHSGSAVGDAITNAMMLIRAQLRAMGYRSEIYVEHLDPALAGDLHRLDDLPSGCDYVLILHFSMGFDAYERILQVPAPKVLMYHNITPAALFADQPVMQRYAELGRWQLAGLRGHVVAALADSDYNVLELRAAGFEDAQSCTLLFDLPALEAREEASPRDAGHPFTLLFVGRVIASKAQADLLEAFARFRTLHAGPSRLKLVGRRDGVGADYARAIDTRIEALGLQDAVTLTGLVTDAELAAHYRDADLYVSLSRHEGFGVPLVEAAAIGLPVLAWPAGAVAYTLGGSAGMLAARDPDHVAARLAELAADPAARAAIARAQRAALARFDLAAQMSTMTLALARAGAPPPQDTVAAGLYARNLRFTVSGHVRGSYSLAAINRSVALALEAARPGHVRLAPVEGEPTTDLGRLPDAERDAVQSLAGLPAHESGPVVVISQHYPVHVPQEPADARLAYVFWEESLIPPATVDVLNAHFHAVLAPSRFVAKALVDSGVSRPVHTVGFAPDLSAYAGLPGPYPAQPGGCTTFLHVSSAFPRKGVDVLLAAYARAFRAADPVRLVIKTFPNPHNDAAARIAALRQADPDAPYIELVDADLDDAGLLALFAAANAIVLPARGEGFNLPAAEAMAAGVPLIVTGFGGHMDFCDASNARLVTYRLAISRSHVASAMSLWAEPDVDDLASALREMLTDHAEATARAARARTQAADAFSRAAFVNRIDAAALDALARPSPGPLRLCLISSWDVRCGVGDYAGFLIEAMVGADPAIDVSVLADRRAPVPSARRGLRMRPAWTVQSADAPAALRQAVATEDPDVVLIQHQPGLLSWRTLGETLLALAHPGRPIAVTLHNTASLPEMETGECDRAVEGLLLCARVIVHTLADVERLRGLGLQDNVTMIPHGGPEPGPVKPERTLLPTDAVTIGCCGFLLPGKGIPALVQAAGLLRARWPKLRLRLVNADYETQDSHAEAARVRAAIREAGLDDAVDLITDYLPFQEVRWRLGRCDAIVLPYPESKEGASGAMRMALSAGPCVAVTPISFFDEAGDAVWRLPGAAPAQIAAGLDALLSDQDARAQTRRAASAWLRDRQWETVGARTAGLLRGLAANARRPA